MNKEKVLQKVKAFVAALIPGNKLSVESIMHRCVTCSCLQKSSITSTKASLKINQGGRAGFMKSVPGRLGSVHP